ncbi:MAG: hypothetical protein LBG70_00390 [Bifidobacteriaceae bacterium]|jgi:hypothetical protein|nr:hypothetical protein [Bifidobacteriaceae bacterium]
MKTQLRRKLTGLLLASALAGTSCLIGGLTATAAVQPIDDVTLSWGINLESGSGAYAPGTCNFISAGVAGNTGSSRTWTEADGFYAALAGNVAIEKPTADAGWAAPTWATKCQNADGLAVNTSGRTSGNRVKLRGGVGQVDLSTGTATVAWQGSFTVAYYSGMTYWTATDPVLTVNQNGTGQLVATGSGYGASMDDPTVWTTLAPRQITLANFKNIDLGEDGFTVTPEYLGVTVTGVSQTTSGDTWGSFPQDFINFQLETGQSSYWYSSGGSSDARKVASPVTVNWDAAGGTGTLAPQVAVSQVRLSDNGTTTITVQGSGFDPAAVTGVYPPLAGKSSGVYVAFGRFAENWRPSAGANSAARPTAAVRWAVLAEFINTVGGTNNGAIELTEDGSFTATFEVSKIAADAAAEAKGLVGGNYGIYTYPGGGAAQPAFETYTAITFGPGIPVEVEVPEGTPDAGEFSWRIAGNAAVSLGTATELTDGFAANGALPNIEVTDTRIASAEWSLSGQVTDFVGTAGSFGGQYLGWTPAVANAGAGAQAGAAVVPEAQGGLSTAKTLAFANAGHVLGTATVAAGLALKVPATTAAGNYTGLLTITAVG